MIVAKRGRAVVMAFIAIIAIGCVAIWFVSTPDAYKRVTHTADKGNGRSSLWVVGGPHLARTTRSRAWASTTTACTRRAT